MSGFHPLEAMKAHPYITAGGVIGVILAIWLFSRGSPAPAQSSSGGSAVDAAAITAAASQGLAQTQATMNATNATTAATINQQNADAAVAINKQNTDAATLLGQLNQALGLATVNVQGQVATSQVQGAVDIAKTNANTITTVNGQNVNGAVTLKTLDNENNLVQNGGLFSTVSALYQEYEGRPGDTPGILYWTNQLANGDISMSGLIDAFRTAPETISHWTAVNPSNPAPFTPSTSTPAPSGGASSPSVSSTISNLYASIGQQPDAAGAAYWQNALDSGSVTLEQVQAAFAAKKG